MNFLINAPALANEYMFSYSIDGDPNFEGTFSQFLAQECTDNNFDIPEGKTYQFTFNECEDIIRWRIENNEFECNPISISIEGDKVNINNGKFVDISDVPVNLTILFGDSSINLNPIISPSDYGGDDVLYIFESPNLDELENAGEPTYQYLIKEGLSIIPINGENYYKFVVSSGENLEYYSFDGSNINIYKSSFYLKIESITEDKISVIVGTSINEITSNAPTDIAYETNSINLNICFTGESGQNTTPEPPTTPEPSTTPEPTYTITVRANNAEYGSVTMSPEGGNYTAGTSVTLIATANNGYRFTHWNDNNTQSPRTVVIEGNATYIATFAQEYEITTKANDYEGTTSGDGNYIIGQNVVLAAIPEEGYYFVKWIKDENFEVTISTDATYRFQMTADAAGQYFAVFAPGAKTITVSVSSGNGNVLLSTGGSMLGEHQYAGDSEITFTATPDPGYHFKNWNGIDGDEPTITAMVHDLPESFDVVFEQTIYTITVENPDPTYGTAGIVGGESNELEQSATFFYGDTCKIQANPEKGYKFVRWDDENTDNPRTFAVTESITYIPIFTDAIKRIINVGVEGNGNVTGAGEYYEGETATLVAVPDSGYHFVHWKDDETAPATRNILVTEDLEDGIEFTAVFEEDLPDTVTISLSTYPNDSGSVSGGGVKPYNSSVTATATANTGYTFVNWKEGASVVSKNANYTFTATTNRTLVANFTKESYTITVSSNNNSYGTVSGGGSYEYGDTVNLSATATTGYNFVNWTENGSVVSTKANYSFTASKSRTLVANFTTGTVSIVAIVNPDDEAGYVDGTGNYVIGQTATLIARPANENIRFLRWEKTDNPGQTVSTEATYSFKVTQADSYTAYFGVPEMVTIGAKPKPQNSGDIEGDGKYVVGTDVILSATPKDGYIFDHWENEEGTTISTNNPYTFSAGKDLNITAIFIQINVIFHISESCKQYSFDYDGETYNSVEDCNNHSDVLKLDYDYRISGITIDEPDLEYHGVMLDGGTKVTTSDSLSFNISGKSASNMTITFTNLDDETVVTETNVNLSSGKLELMILAEVLHTVTISANPVAGGSVGIGSANGPKYAQYVKGETLTLYASADTSYDIASWTINNETIDNSEGLTSYEIEVNDEDIEVIVDFTLVKYEVTIAANNRNYGSVSAEGYTITNDDTIEVVRGNSVNIAATPKTGCKFTGWDDGVSSRTRTITPVEDEECYIANFALNTYQITATSDNTNMGTVSGGGQYNHGASVTLTATPATGHHFVNWKKNGTVVGTNETLTFTASATESYVAYFAVNSYTVTVSLSPSEAAQSVSGAGTYNYGNTAELRITGINSGWTFIGWKKNGTVVSTNTSYDLTVTEGGEYVATFSQDAYTLEVTSDNPTYGTIQINGDGRAYDDSVEIIATTTQRYYKFVGWYDNGSSELNTTGTKTTNQDGTETIRRTITIKGNATYVAVFAKREYRITVNSNGFGAVNGGNDLYEYGTQITISAGTPSAHYEFTHWDDGETSSSREITVTEAKTYTAYFELVTYPVTGEVALDDNNEKHGTVYVNGVSGEPVNVGWNLTCEIVAVPDTHYRFVSWNDGNTECERTVTIVEEKTYIATFTIITYEISATSNNDDWGTVTGGGTYDWGTEGVQLVASPAEHYHFVQWDDRINTNPRPLNMIEANATYVAEFAINQHQVTVTSNNNGWGTVACDHVNGIYDWNSSARLTATPNVADHYHFVEWDDHNTDNPRTVTVAAPESDNDGTNTYQAIFAKDQRTITLSSNDNAWGTVSGEGTFDYGTEVTIVATHADHYHFIGWSDGNTNESRTFQIKDNVTLTANFIIDSHTVSAPDIENGYVTNLGTYNYGLTITVIANADEHYHFDKWADMSDLEYAEQDRTNPTRTITIGDNDIVLQPLFEIDTHEITLEVRAGNGSVDGDNMIAGTGIFDWGTEINIEATPDEHWDFVNWTDDENTVISTDEQTTITVGDEDATYYATFTIHQHPVTCNITGQGSVGGEGKYDWNTDATLTETPAAHYHFVEWNDGSTNNTYTFTVTEDTVCEATFEIDKHEIFVNVEGSGSVEGAGTYDWNSQHTLKAIPAEHWHFLKWSDNIETATRTITVTDDNNLNTYTAIFEIDKHTITVSADGPGVIAVRSEGNDGITAQVVADYGSTVVVYAVPDYKCFLINWNDDDNVPVNGTGREVATINGVTYYDEYTLEILVEGNAEYVAYFDNIPKEVVTTMPPQPNSHAIIYNGADANSILCAELTKYLILEDAAEKDIEVEDIDVINYTAIKDITTLTQTYESVTICGVVMNDKITSAIYNWFRNNMLFVSNDNTQIEAINKISIGINRIDAPYILVSHEYVIEHPEDLYYKYNEKNSIKFNQISYNDIVGYNKTEQKNEYIAAFDVYIKGDDGNSFKNMAAYKQVTVPTQEAIDALIPIDRQSFNKKIMAMMDLGEPVMYDYFVNNILSANTEVVNEIVAAGEEEIVEETKRLVQQFNRYGSDIWKVGNNRKAIVMMTGISLPAGFVVDEMFDEYDSLITFNRLNDSDFEVSIYNVMHQLKDWNGRRRLTTDEKILLQKNMFDAGAYMRDHYQGTGTPVYGTAIINEDKFTSLLKAKKL